MAHIDEEAQNVRFRAHGLLPEWQHGPQMIEVEDGILQSLQCICGAQFFPGQNIQAAFCRLFHEETQKAIAEAVPLSRAEVTRLIDTAMQAHKEHYHRHTDD